MAFDWKPRQMAVRRQIAKFGVAMGFRYDTTEVNPATDEVIGSGEDTEIETIGVLTEEERSFKDLDGATLKKFEVAMLAAVDEDGNEIDAPDASMRFFIGDSEYELAEVDAVRPGNVPLFYRAYFTR